MHPDWEAIGATGEIVGAGAVVLSLLFLGHQLRQNTRSVRGSTRARVTEISATRLRKSRGGLRGRPDRRLRGYRELGNRDQLRFASFVLRILKSLEDAFFQWTEGDSSRRGGIVCRE